MSGHTPWPELTSEYRADPCRGAAIAATRLRIERAPTRPSGPEILWRVTSIHEDTERPGMIADWWGFIQKRQDSSPAA